MFGSDRLSKNPRWNRHISLCFLRFQISLSYYYIFPLFSQISIVQSFLDYCSRKWKQASFQILQLVYSINHQATAYGHRGSIEKCFSSADISIRYVRTTSIIPITETLLRRKIRSNNVVSLLVSIRFKLP